MSRPQGHPKQQHYVPQLLLRGFATGPSEQVVAFDKQTARVFRTSIRNVAGETAFYDLPRPDGLATMEPGLARLEAAVAPLIDRVRSERSLAGLDRRDRIRVALFAVVQHHRTANFRALMSQMNADVAAKFRRLGMDPRNIEGFKEFDADDVKRFTLKMISEAEQFVPYLLDKGWALLEASPGTQYYIGDNPLTLQNTTNRGPRGGLGFGVPGIEIYLPLSSDLTLGWFSETLVAQVRDAVETARKAKIRRPLDSLRLDAMVEGARRFVVAFETGQAMTGIPENTINLNSLQVRAAERFILSRHDDFDLAREMLQTNPELRRGLRGEVS